MHADYKCDQLSESPINVHNSDLEKNSSIGWKNA